MPVTSWLTAAKKTPKTNLNNPFAMKPVSFLRFCKPTGYLFVLLCCVILHQTASGQTYNKTSSVTYTYGQLNTAKQLYTRDSYAIACAMPAVQTMIKNAVLRGKVDFGDDYDLGSNLTTCTMDVEVKAYSTYSGSGGLLATYNHTLTATSGSPEQMFSYDFTNTYYQVARFEVTVTSYTVTPAAAQNTVRLRVYYDEEFTYNVATFTGQPLCALTAVTTPISSNPVTFNWTTTCGPAPNYQFQLLRLYNTNTANTSNEYVVSALVDWNQALNIETGNSTTSLTLTLTEGKGYYIWRVRPIGTAFEGGIANWRNWGEWSTAPAQGATLSLVNADGTNNSGAAYRFFYNQFDDDKNWSYSRVFVEGANDGSTQVSIGEQISYASALLMPKQQQGKLLQENDVLASQTIQDYSGRSALATLAAPLGQSYLQYKTSYILDRANGLYTADDFDQDGFLLVPSPVHANSKLTEYYSDQNPDLTIPSSTDGLDSAYPYVRTRFFRDGNNRAKETSMAGGTHKLGSGKTARASYSGVSDIELIRLFGDEAPANTSVHKMISTDQNNTSSVVYVGKEGQTIATCLSVNPNNTLLDHLPSTPVAGFTVRDTLQNNMPYGSNGITSSQQVSFTDATTVTLYYDITPPYLEDACMPLCRTCDYKIKFLIFNLDDPTTPAFKDSMTVSPDTTCTNTLRFKGTSYGASFATANLPAGDYLIERRVESFRTNTSTGQTYLHEADSVLNYRLEQRFLHGTGTILGTVTVVDMDNIFGFLSRSSTDSLYDYLGANSGDSVKCIVMSCDTFCIPIVRCHEYDCSDSTPDFEDYLIDRWSHKYGSTLSTYLPGYSSGQFNTLIANMIATSDYNCYQVWTCWDAAVQAYDGMVTQMTAVGETFDLLDYFLTCTGYHTTGFTTTAHGSPGYLSHAYSHFNYTAGTNTSCEIAFCCPTSTVTCTCSSPQFSAFTPTQWNNFRLCVQNVSGSAPTNTDILTYAQAAEDTCRRVCENRFGSFVQELITLYHDSGFAVEGNVYPDTGYTPTDTISMDRIYCQAQNLVEACQGNCNLTVYYNSGVPTQIDSVGSQAEQLAMQQAMSWSFDLALPNSGGDCADGYTDVDTVNSSRVGKLVRYLNHELQAERDSAGIYGKYWNYKVKAAAFDTTLTGTSCLTSMNTKPYVYLHPEIDSKFASGYELLKTDSTSDAYTLYERIYPVQVKPGTRFFVTTRITVKQTLSSGSTGFTDAINHANFTLISGSMSKSLSATVAAGTVITSTYVLECASGASGSYTFVTGSATRTGQSNLTLNTPSIYATACPSLNYVFNTTREPIASLSSVSNGTGGIKYYSGQTVNTDTVLNRDIRNNTVTWLTSTGFDPLQAGTSGYKQVAAADSALHNPTVVTPTTTMYLYSQAEWTKMICETLCEVNDTCPKVCLKWVEIDLPDSVVVNSISCEEQTATYLTEYLGDLIAKAIEKHRDEWAAAYNDSCRAHVNLNDHFSFSYELNYYHYTLYYYDRAGNLIQTVPPHGVDLSSTIRSQHPAHKFVTRYVYNSLQQLRWQNTPDGGETWFWYNTKTQLRYSQDAKQKALSGGQAWSYVLYDALGRPSESGEFDPTSAIDTTVAAINGLTYPAPSDGTVRQRTFTVYTTPGSGVVYFGNLPQRYLQNRVSYSWHDDDGNTGTTGDQAYSYFSYDPRGNMEWLIQEQPDLGRSYMAYEYDLISGNVLKVKYNEQLSDKFFHRYTYDKDKRLVTAETSIDNVLWDKDVTYEYYKHGPLKRSNIGEDKVQGLDHIYTINGWIKAVNHPSLVAANDPGQDGHTSGSHQNTARDIWGTILGYFADDFKRTYSSTPSLFNSNVSNTWHLAGGPLYNGNITSWTSHIGYTLGGGYNYEQLTGNKYRYDDLNRLTESDFQIYSSGWGDAPNNNYDEAFSYDGNGNFDQVTRNGYYNGTTSAMDQFTYKYYEASTSTYGVSYTFSSVPAGARNRLAYVDDAASSGNYATDIDDQSAGNYTYDEIGNLTADVAEGISAITWTPAGKIASVTKTSGQVINYYYDAMGQRIRKENIVDATDHTQNKTTYYVRDAQGNVMSIYERTNTGSAPNFTATFKMTEQPIYGSSRIGERRETAMTIRTVNYTTPAGPATPVQTILHADALEKTAVPVGVLNIVNNIAYTTMSVQTLNTAGTAASGSSKLTLSGMQGRNTSSVEDECGNVVLTTYTARKYNAQNHVCMLFDRHGYLVTNSAGIRSDADGQSVLLKMPGSQSLYYLFTVGTNGVPYYHVVDAGANVVVSKNTPLDAAGGYGRNMTLAEDLTGTGYASRLYLRYYSSGSSAVNSFTITAQGISATAALATFTSGDIKGEGELQISADGSEFIVLNNKGNKNIITQTFASGGEFRRYNMSADHSTLSSVSTQTTPNNTGIRSGAWTGTDTYVYYTKQISSGTTYLERLAISGMTTGSLSNTVVPQANVRRGNNGKMYTASPNGATYKEVSTPDGVTPTQSTVVVTSPSKLRGGLPVQKHVIYLLNTCPGNTFTRTVDHKVYELSDHLGNVRVVITDVKNSTINGGTNLPENYTVDAVAYTNYYAFGAPLPGRTANSPDYRYGFNGKEVDAENGGNLDFGARIYNPLLGRFLSQDPWEHKYAWQSTYVFAGNSPIKLVDIDGKGPGTGNGSGASDEEKNNALNLISKKEKESYATRAFGRISPEKFFKDLRAAISDPGSVQLNKVGNYTCPVTTLAFLAAYHAPEEFARAAIELYKNGETTIWGNKITPSSTLRLMSSQADRNSAATILTFSIREDYNSYFRMNTSFKYAGSTTSSMMTELVGLFRLDSKKLGSGYFTDAISKDDLPTLKTLINNGYTPYILGTYAQIDAKTPNRYMDPAADLAGGDHFFVLVGTFNYSIAENSVTFKYFDNHGGTRLKTMKLDVFMDIASEIHVPIPFKKAGGKK